MRRYLTTTLLVMVAVTLTAQPVTVTATVSGGSGLDLGAYRGEVILVDFWASWCIPCRRSFPWMNDMHRKYADDGLIIVAVNLDQSSDEAAAFLEKYPAEFLVHYDPTGETAREYQIEVMPSSVLIGRDGELIDRHAGFKIKQQDEYEARIRRALNLEIEE